MTGEAFSAVLDTCEGLRVRYCGWVMTHAVIFCFAAFAYDLDEPS